VKLAASWQSGLETPSGHKQWKLGLRLVASALDNGSHSDAGFALILNPSNVPTGIETADVWSSFYAKAFRLSAEEARDVAPVARN
jgi:hypothetical protein